MNSLSIFVRKQNSFPICPSIPAAHLPFFHSKTTFCRFFRRIEWDFFQEDGSLEPPKAGEEEGWEFRVPGRAQGGETGETATDSKGWLGWPPILFLHREFGKTVNGSFCLVGAVSFLASFGVTSLQSWKNLGVQDIRYEFGLGGHGI